MIASKNQSLLEYVNDKLIMWVYAKQTSQSLNGLRILAKIQKVLISPAGVI